MKYETYEAKAKKLMNGNPKKDLQASRVLAKAKSIDKRITMRQLIIITWALR
jgi:hypothetical protein